MSTWTEERDRRVAAGLTPWTDEQIAEYRAAAEAIEEELPGGRPKTRYMDNIMASERYARAAMEAVWSLRDARSAGLLPQEPQP